MLLIGESDSVDPREIVSQSFELFCFLLVPSTAKERVGVCQDKDDLENTGLR